MGQPSFMRCCQLSQKCWRIFLLILPAKQKLNKLLSENEYYSLDLYSFIFCRIYLMTVCFFNLKKNRDTYITMRTTTDGKYILLLGPLWILDLYLLITFMGQIDILVGWLDGLVLWHINLCRLFNAKSIFVQLVLFKKIQFSMTTQFTCQKHFYFKLFSLFKQF